jgi:prolyl-tRNA editing enzyme YbaK/EbsC (Cys-tRNA(Pro) deacylase)
MPNYDPESLKKVKDAMLDKGLTCNITQFSETTKTAKDAASAIGCSIEQIGKSIVFRTCVTNKPILVLASGSNRVNEKTLEGYVGEQVIKADAEFVKENTGFVIGGVPPLGHSKKIDIFIDKDLLIYNEIWVAAGSSNTVFKMNKNDLLKISSLVINIK